MLALITARGGSKGIKDKNIALLGGKPLIAHSIEVARQSRYIDDVVVTTDSPQIAEVAASYGARVPFLRPAELATDTSKSIEAILHAIKTLREQGCSYDVFILLQPTQPLRTVEEVDRAVETFFENGQEALASVSLVKDHPLLIRSIGEDGKLKSLLGCQSTCRRQDMPVYYRVNGCIYINKIEELNEETSFNDNPIPFRMERSHSVDIDDLVDLATAEYYLAQR